MRLDPRTQFIGIAPSDHGIDQPITEVAGEIRIAKPKCAEIFCVARSGQT